MYAIQVFLNAGEFNLCPADYCQPSSVTESTGSSGLADGVSGRKAPVERFTPPSRVIEEVKQIMSAANIEVGGVEYLVNALDDQVYFYDITPFPCCCHQLMWLVSILFPSWWLV